MEKLKDECVSAAKEYKSCLLGSAPINMIPNFLRSEKERDLKVSLFKTGDAVS